MTWIRKAAAAVGVTVGLAAGGYWVSRAPQQAPSIKHEHRWPKGSHLTGDDQGRVCHEIHRRYADGRDVLLKGPHYIEGRDFRKAKDDTERRQWLEDHVLADEQEEGLACNESPGFYFPPAYAQPKCTDCGGGCGDLECPATLYAPGCALGGGNCLITYICCPGPCGNYC